MEKNMQNEAETLIEEQDLPEVKDESTEDSHLVFTVEEKDAKSRIDKYLCQALDCSRKRAADLLVEGCVTINGSIPKASAKVHAGDEVVVDMPEDEDLEVRAEDIPLDIVYEDHDIIVVNKPKGMVVHPAPGLYSGTLVNALMYHCKDLSGINGVNRPGIVHRIDKDTSGLLVVAKNDKAHESLAKQIANKTCRREYLAIVHGTFAHTIGTIDAPIGRDDKDRQMMAVTGKNSKPAITHFEVLKNYDKYSLLKCRLETGRTHQIRVHMAYIGHPVAGDPKYGRRKTLSTNGQLLHACALELDHPITGVHMRFEAEPDETFKKVLKELDEGLL